MTMKITSDWLSMRILEFIAVLDTCLTETTFVEDRRLYASDVAVAANWLARLHGGEQASLVANEILEPATAKQFTDYWRQGAWGERESAALSNLQDDIRKKHIAR